MRINLEIATILDNIDTTDQIINMNKITFVNKTKLDVYILHSLYLTRITNDISWKQYRSNLNL